MAKTLFIAVLTLCVSIGYAEQFEDIKKPSSAAEWNEAAAAIGMAALVVEAGKPEKPEAGKVFFTLNGQQTTANSYFPIVPSKTKPGQMERTVDGKTAAILMNESMMNKKLFRNLLLEVLKVANSKDEKKAKAASIVASEFLRAQYGKSLEDLAPEAKPSFLGASGLLGKGRHSGKMDLGVGDKRDDGHAELPEARPAARMLNYLQNPKEWVPASDCSGTDCKPLPGQIMNPKLGGNLAIDDKLAAALIGIAPPAAATKAAPTSEEADAWILARLKEAKAAGQKKLLIKFGDDAHCDPCKRLSVRLKKIDPTGKSYVAGDVRLDAGANAAFWKYNDKSNSIPCLLYTSDAADE